MGKLGTRYRGPPTRSFPNPPQSWLEYANDRLATTKINVAGSLKNGEQVIVDDAALAKDRTFVLLRPLAKQTSRQIQGTCAVIGTAHEGIAETHLLCCQSPDIRRSARNAKDVLRVLHRPAAVVGKSDGHHRVANKGIGDHRNPVRSLRPMCRSIGPVHGAGDVTGLLMHPAQRLGVSRLQDGEAVAQLAVGGTTAQSIKYRDLHRYVIAQPAGRYRTGSSVKFVKRLVQLQQHLVRGRDTTQSTLQRAQHHAAKHTDTQPGKQVTT